MNKYYVIIHLLLISLIAKTQSHLPCRIESDKSSDWKCLGPFNLTTQIADQHFGAVSAISVNPSNENEIYIGTGCSGLFYTSNKGKNWLCLTDNFPYPVIGINKIIVDYTKNPRPIILATGRNNDWYDGMNVGVLISKDGGQHWSHTYPNPDHIVAAPTLFNLVIDSARGIWYASEKNKIYRTHDEGEHWDEIFSKKRFPNEVYSDEFYINSMELNKEGTSLFLATNAYPIYNKTNDSILFEADFIKLKKCNDSLQNMQCISMRKHIDKKYTPPENNQASVYKVTKANNSSNELYITRQYIKNKETDIFTFNIKNEVCEKVEYPNNKHFGEDLFWFEGLRVNAVNPNIMYFTGFTLYKSLDSGKHFTSLYPYAYGENNIPHADIRSLLITQHTADGKGDHIFLGTDGGLSFSDNGGQTFTNLNGESLPITEFYGFGVSPFNGIISAGSQDNSIFSYDPTKKVWISTIRGDGYDVDYSKLKPNIAYGEYNGLQISQTNNDLAPFEFYVKGPSTGGCNKKNLATHKNGNLYFADKEFHILHKNTSQWKTYQTKTPHQALAFAVSETDSNIIYLSSFWSGLFKSADGGRSFHEITHQIKIAEIPLGNTRIHAICISPYTANELWISLGYLGDYIDVCKQSMRVLHSSNGGETWEDYSEGLPIYNVSDIVFVDGTSSTLFASTVEGVYIRENQNEPWKLFSTHLPKCVISELQISYSRNKLIASTYGRGLWETALPTLHYDQVLEIKKDTIFKVEKNDEALYFTKNIKLKNKVNLEIRCPVYFSPNKKIIAKRKKQIHLVGNGIIIYQ